MNKLLRTIAPVVLVLFFCAAVVGPVFGEDKIISSAASQLATSETGTNTVEAMLKQKSDKAFTDRITYASVFSLMGAFFLNSNGVTARNTGALYAVMGLYNWLFKYADETKYDEYQKGNTNYSSPKLSPFSGYVVLGSAIAGASLFYNYQTSLDPTYSTLYFHWIVFDLLPSAYIGAYIGMHTCSLVENALHVGNTGTNEASAK